MATLTKGCVAFEIFKTFKHSFGSFIGRLEQSTWTSLPSSMSVVRAVVTFGIFVCTMSQARSHTRDQSGQSDYA